MYVLEGHSDLGGKGGGEDYSLPLNDGASSRWLMIGLLPFLFFLFPSSSFYLTSLFVYFCLVFLGHIVYVLAPTLTGTCAWVEERERERKRKRSIGIGSIGSQR